MAKVTVRVVTHGEHAKGGRGGRSRYDGPLCLSEGSEVRLSLTRETLERSTSLRCARRFRGEMLRHEETANRLQVSATPVRQCGNDDDAFQALDPEDPNCQEPVLAFERWLGQVACENPHQPILLIGSRILPLLILYLQYGGEAKFGKFAYFANAITEVDWGVDIPHLQNGSLLSFELNFAFHDGDGHIVPVVKG